VLELERLAEALEQALASAEDDRTQ